MLENYIATYLLDIVALIILCFLLHGNHVLDQNRKCPFYLGIMLTILVILSEVGTIIGSFEYADLLLLHIFCNVIGFALTPLIPIVLITIFDVRILKANKFLLLPSVLNLAATVLSPHFGLVFSINAGNHYQRGSAFFIFVAAYLFNMIILLFNTFWTRQKNHYPIKVRMTVLTLFTVAGTNIQLMAPSIYSSWHCVTLSLLLYYLLLSEFDGSLDKLTRFLNRAAFEKATRKLTNKNAFSVIILDINDFKEINDKYGHNFGDEALKTVAGIIGKSFDNRCTCYRIGGDEFLVISRESNQEKLESQLKSMTNNLSEARRSISCLPTVAYGYSIFQGGTVPDFQKIFQEADGQMYRFKEMHKRERCRVQQS